jgi:hypothetical protein
MSDDISDLVDNERFREILSLKKRVLDTRDEIDRAMLSGQRRRGPVIGLYQRKVRDYVMSVETVLNPHDEQPSRYWTEVPIGEFELPSGETQQIIGLGEFLELPTVFAVEVEEKQQTSYRHKSDTVTKEQNFRPPERVIESAFRVTNRALDSVGFDIDEPSAEDKKPFQHGVDDVEKATRVYQFMSTLDDSALRELKNVIDSELLGQPDKLKNGHNE